MLGSLKKSSLIAKAGLTAAMLLVAASSANAAMITFTATGTSGAGLPLSASAEFTTSDGQITIVLTNLLDPSQIISSGQALSDIQFTLSNDAGTVGTATASGQLGEFGPNTPVTYVAGDPTRWLGVGGGEYTVNGSTVLLEAIGGGMPDQMILPFVNEGDSYPNDNMGVDNFIPYVIGPATFVLNLSGVTANTTVTGAIFSFGTGPDTFIETGSGGGGGGGQTVPEPASLALFGLAALGAAYRVRRSK